MIGQARQPKTLPCRRFEGPAPPAASSIARPLSDWVESESGLDVDTWSHFLRKTGIHFSGKCSNAPLDAETTGARQRRFGDDRRGHRRPGALPSVVRRLRVLLVLLPTAPGFRGLARRGALSRARLRAL